MSDEIVIDGLSYISSKRASESSGYAQDYIGQLSRGGQIQARRVGGLWYVSTDSLQKYKEQADLYKPEPPPNINQSFDQESLLSFDGKAYVSAGKASKMTGYHQDYVGQLARGGTIPSRQIGNRWYIEKEGVLAHKKSKDDLLGAVQAESVGIKRVVREEVEKSAAGYGGPGPFLSYTSDNRDLIPDLGEPTMEEPKDVTDEEYSIPIRVIQNRMPVAQGSDEFYRRHRGDIIAPIARIPEKTMYSLAIPVAVLTIVIVLSLGFVSLKTSSIYTKTDTRTTDQTVMTASAAGSFVTMIGDLLESWLAPEIVYRKVR